MQYTNATVLCMCEGFYTHQEHMTSNCTTTIPVLVAHMTLYLIHSNIIIIYGFGHVYTIT